MAGTQLETLPRAPLAHALLDRAPLSPLEHGPQLPVGGRLLHPELVRDEALLRGVKEGACDAQIDARQDRRHCVHAQRRRGRARRLSAA